MKIRVCYNSWLVRKGYKAWVLFPFMFFRQKKEEVTDTLFRHEMQHVYQVLQIGWFKFYLTYLWYLWRRGYRQVPYELEAWGVQDTPLTPWERAIKDKQRHAQYG